MIGVEATPTALTIHSLDGLAVDFILFPNGGLEIGTEYLDHNGDKQEAWVDFGPDDATDALLAIQTWIEKLNA